MKTKTRNLLSVLFALLMVHFYTISLHPQDISSSLREIEELYGKEKYSLVLEKSLNILNTKEDRLTPLEAGFLHYYIGLAYKKNQNNEMAADYFKKMTIKYPASDYVKLAYLELADIYKDDYFQKEAFLEKVFEMFPRTPEAVRAGIELSKSYLQLKNYKKALPVMETIVNLWKMGEENPELYVLMMVGYSGIRDYIEAGEYLRQTEKTIPAALQSNPLYLFEAGKILHNNLSFQKAIPYLEQLFNIYPNYKEIPEATILLAQCYEREEKNFLSAVFLIKAIEKQPPQKQLHSLFLNLGRILGKLDEKELIKIQRSYPLYADAKKLLTFVKNNSLDFDQKRTAAILLSDEFKKTDNMEKVVDNFYNFLGEKRDPLVEKLFKQNLDNYLYDLEKKENFDEIFKTWLKLKSRKSYLSPENLLRFGDVLSRMKLYASAVEIYQHLLKYQMYADYWLPARKQLIRLHFQMGQYEECLRQFQRLEVAQDPEKDEFTYYRLLSYRHLAQDSEFQKLLDSPDANFSEITNIFRYRIAQLRAEQLEKQKNYNDALTIYQQLINFNQIPKEDEGQLMVSIANLYYMSDDLESALGYYRLAEKYNTNLEWVLFRIIGILKEQDKTSEGEVEMEKLKKLNPNSFWVKQLEKDVR